MAPEDDLQAGMVDIFLTNDGYEWAQLTGVQHHSRVYGPESHKKTRKVNIRSKPMSNTPPGLILGPFLEFLTDFVQ